MAQNIDDFFKHKIENIQDTLPENSGFDENLLWVKVQQDLRKPKRSTWVWLAPVAACLVVLIGWWTIKPHPTLPNRESFNSPLPFRRGVGGEVKMVNLKPQLKVLKSKINKNKIIQHQKLDFQVENIASKNLDFSSKTFNNLPDSLNFQSNIVFEKKPKITFKVVHINEISKQDDAPFKQPRFKVQFAGTLFEKTISNETIQTPSIRIQ